MYYYNTTIEGATPDNLSFEYHPDHSLLLEEFNGKKSVKCLENPDRFICNFLLDKTFENLNITLSYLSCYRYMLLTYSEIVNDNIFSTISRIDTHSKEFSEEVLLKGNFEIESDILYDTCVLSKIDPTTNKKVYGVYSFKVSKMCVDFGLTSIEPYWYDGKAEFKCTFPDGNVVNLDKDGFVVIREEKGNQRNRTDR